MGVCRQLLPVFGMSLLVMVITVRHFSSLEPRDDLCTLDIDYVRLAKCFRMFSAITKEIDNTKRCMAAMSGQQSLPADKSWTNTHLCSVYEQSVKLSLLRFQIEACDHLTYDDIVSFSFDVADTILKFEWCLTKLQYLQPAMAVSGPQCVTGLYDRVWKINSDIEKCLNFPTIGQKFWKQVGSIGGLPHAVLFVGLFLTLLPSLRQLSARTEKIAIVLILAVLLLFVGCHFLCKEIFVQYSFKVIASTNVISHGIFKRIEVLDLDALIGRDHSKWRPSSSRDKTVWRYLGEDVLLLCNITLSFNTQKLRHEDIEVDWFHNRRKLLFRFNFSVFKPTITLHGNTGAIVMLVAVRHLTAGDFGSYSCKISQRLQQFVTLSRDWSFPTGVHQILPQEITISIPPGSMLKVKYSQFMIPYRLQDYRKFYRRVNDVTMEWTLGQPLEGCSLWTVLQNDIYNMINEGPRNHFTSNEIFGGVLSFCVPSEDFGRHEFVIERFDNTAFRTDTHPVSLIVKPPGDIDKSEYNDFFGAVSTLFDALLIILLGFISNVTGSVVTFCFLWIFRRVLRKLIPAVALKFLKQEFRRQKIYIACSPRDRAWTNRNVVEFLESLGHETFLPARDCPPNHLEIEALAEGVLTCHKYVMVVSRHFLGEQQWRFERSLIMDELQQRQCCPDGEHPTCLLFVCVGGAEVPGPRLGGSVLHAPQTRRRGDLKCQVRSWLEDAVFHEEEWSTWYLLGVSVLITIRQSRSLAVVFSSSVLQECYSTFMKWLSPET